MGREDPQLKLRLTKDLKSKITEAARANGRSVNSEIVARLLETFELADAGRSQVESLLSQLRSEAEEQNALWKSSVAELDAMRDKHFAAMKVDMQKAWEQIEEVTRLRAAYEAALKKQTDGNV